MTTSNPLSTQVGGSHYKDCVIQPVEYIHANGLGFIEGAVVKYITRWREKGGLQDLKKIQHFIEMLIHLEKRRVSNLPQQRKEAVDRPNVLDVRTGPTISATPHPQDGERR